MSKLRITVFADPVCTWCWGSVPVLRALLYRYGAQLEIAYVMGGMIEDIKSYSNRRLSIGGDIALSNRNIHSHWLEASSIHGMPVCESGFHLFSHERPSTIPQNLAYLAAKVYVERYGGEVEAMAAHHYLRCVQEATAVDALLTNDVDVLVDMSAVVGFNPAKFRDIYVSDTVKVLYGEGKMLCREYEVQSFPTYLLEYRGEEMLLRGYTSFDIMSQSLEQLSYGKVKPLDGVCKPTAENVMNFIDGYGVAYPVEVATAFDLPRRNGHTALNAESYEGLPDILEELLGAGKLSATPRGNTFLYYALKEGHAPKQHLFVHEHA